MEGDWGEIDRMVANAEKEQALGEGREGKGRGDRPIIGHSTPDRRFEHTV